MDRVRRVTDLFVEGTELHLGDDEEGPILLWINKLNPYQSDDVRRDGNARRAVRMSQLADPESDELKGKQAEVSLWSHDRLAEALVAYQANQIFLDAMNELDTDVDGRQQFEAAQIQMELADDAQAPPEDDLRAEAMKIGESWLAKLKKLQEDKQRRAIDEAKMLPHEELEAQFFEAWRQAETVEIFMQERRTTEIYYATRVCKGTRVQGGNVDWDHEHCDHSRLWLNARSDVQGLPEGLIAKIIDKFDELSVADRTAGFSDAPESSSASSEPSELAEAASTPSFPDGTPSAAPTT